VVAEEGTPRPVGAAGNTARDALENYSPPLGLSIAEAQDLLKWAGDPADYDAWLRLGMALHHEGGGADGWLSVWDMWSQGGANYEGIEDLAQRWIGFGRTVAAGGRPITLKYLVKAAGEARTEALAVAGSADYPRTEAGNAARLVDTWGRDLLFCAELGAWYRWSGKHWRSVSLTEVRHLAKGVVEDMRGDVVLCTTDREKADHMKWCAASQRWTMYDHMVSIASLSAGLWVRASELDGDKRYLGVQNGVVDLWTGELLPPDRSRRVTRLCSVEYRPDAVCPLFEQTLADVFDGQSEMPGFFWRLVGYSITGDPREHLLVLPFGGGGNGKGTLLNALQYVLGDHAVTAHSSTFLRGEDSGGGGGVARPDLIALAGARFVLVSEPDEGSELREGVIKAMAGGDVLPARALYSGTIIQIQPSWTAWISTNHKPLIKGTDGGIWRRVLPVPFLRSFDGDPAKDVARPERLRAEAEGILAWAVRGAVAYRREGLRVPSVVAASRGEYKADMDLLADWVAERCVDGGTDSVSLDALWLDWEPWARVRGELRFVPSRKALSKKLQAKGYLRERGRFGAVFLGLKLRNVSISEDQA
jgi:P4 family phage/plasmid primase-like protien